MEALRSRQFILIEETTQFNTEQSNAIRIRWIIGLARALPFMRATARAVLANEYFDGALEDLEGEGLPVEGERQHLSTSRAPSSEAFERFEWVPASSNTTNITTKITTAFEYIHEDDRDDDVGSSAGSDSVDDEVDELFNDDSDIH